MARPIVFISYSHKDEKEKNQLLSHLDVLQRAGLMGVWTNDQIGVGSDWQIEVSRAINQATVAILLITANFLSSEFILEKELPELLKRHDRGDISVFPVIAKACAWRQVDWLKNMKVRPKDGRPIWSGDDRQVGENLGDIAEEVASLISEPSIHSPSPIHVRRNPQLAPASNQSRKFGAEARRLLNTSSLIEANPLIRSLIRVDGNLEAEERAQLDRIGAEIHTVAGNVVGIEIPFRALPELAKLDFVGRIEISRPLYPESTSNR